MKNCLNSKPDIKKKEQKRKIKLKGNVRDIKKREKIKLGTKERKKEVKQIKEPKK